MNRGARYDPWRETSVAGERGVSVPRVYIFDAEVWGLDEDSLRGRVRRAARTSPTQHVSRSYCFPLGLMAVHDAPVGVDIERIERCDDAFAVSISTPAELAGQWSPGDRDRFVTSRWSSKEALSKALGDALSYDPRRLQGPAAWPDGRSGPWRATTLGVRAGYVAWLCWWHAEAGGRPDRGELQHDAIDS